MLILTLAVIWGGSWVSGYLPPSNPCYQHVSIFNACVYGNLTVAVIGKTLQPADCGSRLNNKVLAHPPVIHINSTNITERFTVAMVDMGLQGRGPAYLQWMVTNVSINALPNLQIRPNDELASYQQPVFLQGVGQPHLIQILVFRHYNTLRVPFGELWTTNRRNFVLSTLYSNTNPNLRLCGPVAGTQYWVFDDNSLISPGAPQTPSAPQLPAAPLHPQQPQIQNQNPSPVHLYPVIPVVPVTHLGQSGYVPSAGQPGMNYPVHQPVTSFPKKSSSTIVHPLKLLLVSSVILVVVHL